MHIQHTIILKNFSIVVLDERIVCRPTYDWEANAIEVLFRDNLSHSARCVNNNILLHLSGETFCRKFLDRLLCQFRPYIADIQFCSSSMEPASEIPSDLTKPLYPDPGQTVACIMKCRPNTGQYPQRSPRRWIPAG